MQVRVCGLFRLPHGVDDGGLRALAGVFRREAPDEASLTIDDKRGLPSDIEQESLGIVLLGAQQLKEDEAASQQRRRYGNGDEQRSDTEPTARSTLSGSLVKTDPIGIGMRHDMIQISTVVRCAMRKNPHSGADESLSVYGCGVMRGPGCHVPRSLANREPSAQQQLDSTTTSVHQASTSLWRTA